MNSGIQVSPIHLKYPPDRFIFDGLNFNTFRGVPGFIADSLPDKYGNQLIDIYMADKSIPASEITTLDRLLYIADRGMGALEFHPGEKLPLQRTALDFHGLAELADMVLRQKKTLQDRLISADEQAAALTFIRIGSSAGGARSKALVALSKKGTLLDGTVNHGPHYTYWILKFDSQANKDLDSTDPKGMPTVEYIYSLIAGHSGIDIPETRLIEEGKDRHFLIRRFDRILNNNKLDKLHYASWAGLGHADRDGVNSYEQLVLLARQLELGQAALTELYRRAVYNVLGRNQDDHTKNFGFLMDRAGRWRLAPAFDMTYSYDPRGRWTRNHQSWLNKKNDDFQMDDLLKFGSYCDLTERKSREIISQSKDAFSMFPKLASEYDLPTKLQKTVESNLRLNIIS